MWEQGGRSGRKGGRGGGALNCIFGVYTLRDGKKEKEWEIRKQRREK